MSDGTRTVAVRIQVDPDDYKKCGDGCYSQWNGGFPVYCNLHGHFSDDDKMKQENPNRLPTCLAAEVEVDKETSLVAEWIIDKSEFFNREVRIIKLAAAYLALVKILKGD